MDTATTGFGPESVPGVKTRPIPPHEDLLEIDQLRIRCRIQGMGDRAVILVHGIGGSFDMDWPGTIAALAGRHRVYALDLAGDGYHARPSDFPCGIPGLARFLEGFMHAMDLERASLVGLAMGSGIVLQFTLDHPGRVEKLVLADSLVIERKVNLVIKLRSTPIPGEIRLQPRPAGAEHARWRMASDPWSVFTGPFDVNGRGALYANKSGLPLWAIPGGCDARNGHDLPIMDRLGEIKAPTLIVRANQGRILPFSFALPAGERIPGARLHVLEGDHRLQLKRAEEFNSLLKDFITS